MSAMHGGIDRDQSRRPVAGISDIEATVQLEVDGQALDTWVPAVKP